MRAKTNHSSHHIFNVDESDFKMCVQSKSSKILAQKGKKQEGAITSSEQDVLSTIMICMPTGQNYIPPIIIFTQKRMEVEEQDDLSASTRFVCHSTRWLHLHIFTGG